ncbi:MAG: MHYT domain-containing protein [Pseudomonadota bacterium]
MYYLAVTHNPWLVLASMCVALIAGFTGLSLTRGLSERSDNQKKIAVALAAVALGGGIWSMHFVAMLGMQLPIDFYYDAAVTLASALVAILVVGVALLLLHFYPRTRLTLTLAGVIVGLGVLAMHYLGMAGMQLCRALYSPAGIAFAVVASCGLNVAAIAIAYGQRSQRNILLGTLCFGLSVVSVHYIAIAGTRFVQEAETFEVGPLLSNDVLALGVILSSFVLCAAFLLTGVTVLQPTATRARTAATGAPALSGPVSAAVEARALAPGGIAPGTAAPETDSGAASEAHDAATPTVHQVPYEENGKTWFVGVDRVVAVRAEGHHTQLYTDSGKRYCVWSITEAERRLTPTPLLKAHRSYLVNPAHVRGFERQKDTGVCYFELPDLTKVPVSRSRLSAVRGALGV